MEKVDLDYNKVAPTLRKNILRKLSVLVLTGVMLAPTVTSIVTTPIVAHAEGETEGGFGSETTEGGEMGTPTENPSDTNTSVGGEVSEGTTGTPENGDLNTGDLGVDGGGLTDGNDITFEENTGTNENNATEDGTIDVNGGAANSGNNGVVKSVQIELTASDASNIDSVLKNVPPIEYKPNAVQPSAGKNLFSKNGNTLKFNVDTFDAATENSRRQAMKQFTTMLQSSAVSNQGQTRIFEELQNTNNTVQKMLLPMVIESTSADVYGGWKVIKPFIPTIRVLFGVMAIGIIIFLIFFTILDLVFVGMPLARDKIQNGSDGKGIFIVKWVSSDAKSVIQETEGGDSSTGYTNPYLLYLKRRGITYLILTLCILYLVVGEIAGVIDWLLSLGNGLVEDSSTYNK